MSDRELQIGIFGTFDVQNYGDLLFPLIAEAELSRRLGPVAVRPFSYSCKTPPDWPYAVRPLVDLPAAAASLDGVILGGGHIIRFGKEIAPGYGTPEPAIHHPTGYWLTPALIALQHGLPVVWNAPGVHGDIPAWAVPLMELAVSQSCYVAVRDEPSRQALARFTQDGEVALVPDTALGLGRLLDAERPSSDFVRLREAVGLTDPYVVIQAMPGLQAFVHLMRDHPRLFPGYRLLALPIGPIHGDDDTALGPDVPDLVRLPRWPSPLLLAELIARAAGVVGVSLHLAFTALAFGVPVFRPAGMFHGKYAVLSSFDTVVPLASNELDPGSVAGRLGRVAPSPAVHAAVAQLIDHWDRIAAVFATGGRPVATREAAGRFWQSTPGLLEAWSARHLAALAARRAALAERDTAVADRDAASVERDVAVAERDVGLARLHRQIVEQSNELQIARAKIAARDERIAALQRSTSWRITAPLRALGTTARRVMNTRRGR